jgi:hypothetical protein
MRVGPSSTRRNVIPSKAKDLNHFHDKDSSLRPALAGLVQNDKSEDFSVDS